MVTLGSDETEALRALAEEERRDPRAQAALLIRRGLERVGLLPRPSGMQTAEVGDQYDVEAQRVCDE
jgi:hypothetical protein